MWIREKERGRKRLFQTLTKGKIVNYNMDQKSNHDIKQIEERD